MIAFIPNDRSVVRMAPGFVIQTGKERESLCVKRLRAMRWLRNRRPHVSTYQAPRLRLVS